MAYYLKSIKFVNKISILLRKLKPSITISQEDISEFYRSEGLAKALLMALGLTLPIVLGVMLEQLDAGIFISLGVLLTSPADTVGSIHSKVRGLLLATALSVVAIFISLILKVPIWLFLPILGILVFCISYISIYGFRASLISFSGLLALVLSLSSLSSSPMPVYVRLLLIAIGGLWYVLLVLFRHALFPHSPTENVLHHTIMLTAQYLETRGKLMDKNNNRNELSRKLLGLQVDLMANHETLRDLLMNTRRNSGKSIYQGKRLLVFRQLVDIFELSMANPVNYSQTDKYFTQYPEALQLVQHLIDRMSARLQHIAECMRSSKTLDEKAHLSFALKQVESMTKPIASEAIHTLSSDELLFRNYAKYLKEEVKKIKKVEWLFRNKDSREIGYIRKKDYKGFLKEENYNPQVLIENFNVKSPIFRHSLRISIVSMVGYIVGYVLNVDNAYWILLTIIVIMRSNYGLTKTRFRQRTLGTLIGGALAFGIVLITHSTTVYAILTIFCFVLGFSMVQKNYKAAATFITMHVLFVYGLLNPDIVSVIQYRVADTLIGAALSIAGNFVLWPTWEIVSIDKAILRAVKASRGYLQEISQFYKTKGEVPTTYKLARKEAFLAVAELSSSFQRMAQEPKSQQKKNIGKIYNLAMLNQTMIAAEASLGTYMIHNPTTPASQKFDRVVKQIEENLNLAAAIVQRKSLSLPTTFFTTNALKEAYGSKYSALVDSSLEEQISLESQIEEAHLILNQLEWLLDMSKDLIKRLQQIDFH